MKLFVHPKAKDFCSLLKDRLTSGSLALLTLDHVERLNKSARAMGSFTFFYVNARIIRPILKFELGVLSSPTTSSLTTAFDK